MPAIQTSAPQSPAPIEVILDAVALCRERGIRIRIGSPGVACTSTHGAIRWELDPLERNPGVCPVGAVALVEQPPACDLPDAVRLALDVPRAWLEGLRDGLELEPEDSRWLSTRQREIYRHGRESGVNLRIHVVSYPGGGQ